MTTLRTVGRRRESRPQPVRERRPKLGERSPVRPSGLQIGLFLLPALAVFALIYAIPIVTMVTTSFSAWNGLSEPIFLGIANYIELISDGDFLIALRNSLLWGALAAFIHVPLGVLVALTLHRRPIGWRFVRSISLFPNLIPPAALALMYIFLFNPGVGLVNEIIRRLGWSDFSVAWFFTPGAAFIAVTSVWLFYAGVIILITLAELSRIPSELRDAAVVDGASPRQIDWHIYVPLLRNVIGVGVIIAVTEVFKMFDYIFLTTGGGPASETVSLGLLIYNQATSRSRVGYANAIGVVLLVMGLIAFYGISRAFGMRREADQT